MTGSCKDKCIADPIIKKGFIKIPTGRNISWIRLGLKKCSICNLCYKYPAIYCPCCQMRLSGRTKRSKNF
jgi:hypothetical protein